MKITLTIFLLSSLAALSQSIELRSVTILGGVEIGVVNTNVASPPAGEGSPGVYAAAFMTNQSAVTTTGVTNFTVDGANKLLLVGVASYRATPTTISSAVWNNSESLTELAVTNWYNTAQKMHLLYLKNPTSATTNVLVTFAEQVGEAHIAVVLVTNANQTDTFGTLVGETKADSSTFVSNVLSASVGDFSFSYSAWEGAANEGASVFANETLTLDVRNPGKVAGGVGTCVFAGTTTTNLVSAPTARTYRGHLTVPVKQP